MKKFYFLATFFCCLFLQQINAQQRYIDEVFTDADITIMKDVQYGVNMSILQKLFVEGVDVPTPDILELNVHMPSAAVDTETDRPAIVLLSGANFLPRYTQTCYGGREDLYMTTLAGKMARRGFVVFVAEMRRGWNPLVTQPNDFLRELADAVQRQAQDVRTLARFLRKDVAENGNSFGIHPEKLTIWGTAHGQGTVATHAAFLKTEEEFESPAYLVQDDNGEIVNIYDATLFGNTYGTEPGFEPGGALSNLPSQTSGCYSSEYNLVVSGAGVNLDTFMVQAGEVPSIWFAPEDWLAAGLEVGPLNLPATGDFCCVTVFGQTYQRQADQLGNVDEWKGIEFSDPIANDRLVYQPNPAYGPVEGAYGIPGEAGNQLPWIYWDEAGCEAVNPAVAELTKTARVGASMENMVQAADEMLRFFAPRACITLDLGCSDITTGLREETVESARVAVSPNPSTGHFSFESPAEYMMEAISIYDISGKLMYQTEVYGSQFSTINLGLANGLYIAKIKFEDGVASKKLTVGE